MIMRHYLWLLLLLGTTACEQFTGPQGEGAAEDSTAQAPAEPSTLDTLRLTGLASSFEQLTARFPNMTFPFKVNNQQLEIWDLNAELLDYQNAVRYLKAEAWPANEPKPNFYPLGKWEVADQEALLYAIQYYPQKGVENIECHLNLYKDEQQIWTGIVGNWYYDPKAGEGSVSSFQLPEATVLIKEKILFEQASLKQPRRQKAYQAKLYRLSKTGVEELDEHPLLQEALFERILPYFPERSLPLRLQLPVAKGEVLPEEYGRFLAEMAENSEAGEQVRSYGRFRLTNGLQLLLYGQRQNETETWAYYASSFKKTDALLATTSVALREKMEDGRLRQRSGRIRSDNALILTDSIFKANALDTLIEEQLLLRSDGRFEKL